MATRTIPLDATDASFEQRVDLDNRPFTFKFFFNDRLGIWHFNLSDDTGEELINGVAMFTKQGLLDKFKHDTRLPQGTLLLLNLIDEDAPPTRESLGMDVLLTYEDAL